MNKTLRVPDYLDHILVAIERIGRHTADINEDAFLTNEMIQDAVIRNLEVIGEAANLIRKVDAVFAESHPEIPWQVMYAMRNRLAHGYDTIDFNVVWQTVGHDLPALYQLIKAAKPSDHI